jgi:aryl-alcohol dehydrogenase-like predicted oxidoreductase
MDEMSNRDLGSGDRRARLVLGSVDLPDAAATARVLDRFRAEGGRALDVANVYREGESAQAVGRWLRARRSPDGFVLYAKGCHPPYCHPDLVGAEVEKACALLGVDQIDVFILHRDDLSFPVAAFADALLAQVSEGRIGGFGVSNWTVGRLRDLRSYLDEVDAGRLAAFSNHFSLAEMVSAPWPGCLALSKEDVLALADVDVTILAWSSLATGFFAGRETPHWDSAGNRARRERAAEIGARLGRSTPSVALAYVLHQPDYLLPVVGTRSEAHLAEAFDAVGIELSPADLEWLETGDGDSGSVDG